MICQCCGQTIKAKKIDQQSVTPSVSTENMTDSELFKYYKRIAPASDLAWTRRNASSELQAIIDAIVKPSAKDAARMRDLRRAELLAVSVANGEPALGSERWFVAQGIRQPIDHPSAINESEAA